MLWILRIHWKYEKLAWQVLWGSPVWLSELNSLMFRMKSFYVSLCILFSGGFPWALTCPIILEVGHPHTHTHTMPKKNLKRLNLFPSCQDLGPSSPDSLHNPAPQFWPLLHCDMLRSSAGFFLSYSPLLDSEPPCKGQELVNIPGRKTTHKISAHLSVIIFFSS